MDINAAVVPGYYLVCYNSRSSQGCSHSAVVPGYYLVCYNAFFSPASAVVAVVPGYYLVCYNITLQHDKFRCCSSRLLLGML